MDAQIVTVDWLMERVNKPGYRVVDCRWVLGKPGEGRQQYEAGHIPGSVHVDVEEHLSNREGPGRHPIPDKRIFQNLMSELGIGRDTHVIAYDDGRAAPAARLWWLLRFYGHDLVSVLNGGWDAWLKAGGPVQTEVMQYPPANFVARPRRKLVMDKSMVDTLRDDPNVLLIDARTPERFRGESEPIDARPGHIPGAENFPYLNVIDPNSGGFRSAEVLGEEFKKMGVDRAKQVICYCGSGITACTDILALNLAGYKAILYEGSWSDWSADQNLPSASTTPPATKTS